MNFRRRKPKKVSIEIRGKFCQGDLVAPERSVVVARTLGVGEVAGSIPAAPKFLPMAKMATSDW